MKKYMPIFIVLGAMFMVLILLTYWKSPKRDVLDGSIWQVVNLDNKPLLEGTTLTIRFHDRKVNGSSGCNTFSGRYKAEGRKLEITLYTLTTMNCLKPGIMEQERSFTGYLTRITSFETSEDKLITTTDDGGVVEFVSLLEE